jgi:hypothetical protein
MAQDPAGQETVLRVRKALRALKERYYFDDDTFYGPDTFIDKWFGTAGTEAKLKHEMQSALNYCDCIGFRLLLSGSVSTAIIVLAENLSNEEAIGRSVVIQKNVTRFTQFSFKRGLAVPFWANVFYVFNTSERAFHFRSRAQDDCKRTNMGLSGIIRVKPWCLDFQGKHVTPPKVFLGGLSSEPAEIESKLFGGVYQ